jgi:phage terminase large subunit
VGTIELGYQARDAFIPLHKRKERFGCIVAHRRAGKTVASILDLLDAALRCTKADPRFAYIAPYYAQAKDVAWNYVKQYAARIPGTSINESELRVDLPNKARIRLYGADNYDRLRGIYLDGVVLDEFADQPPQAWREVIRPALSDRQGWALFIGTPKGRNAFYDVYEHAVATDDWFAMKLQASRTGIIPEGELEALRAQMSANEFNREMECDFDAAIEGAYYAAALADARAQGRIGRVAADPLMTVRLFADIGGTGAKADSFVFWAAQFIGKEVRLLDHYEVQGQPLDAHLAWLRSRGFTPDRAQIWLPHDGATHDKVFAVSYQSAFEQAGYTVTVVPNQGKGAAGARIEATRRLFPAMWFNEDTTKPGLDALASYHEKRDEKRGIGLGPNHDWASHSADAFGLMAVAYEEPKAKKPKPMAPRYRAGGWMAA